MVFRFFRVDAPAFNQCNRVEQFPLVGKCSGHHNAAFGDQMRGWRRRRQLVPQRGDFSVMLQRPVSVCENRVLFD